jgi:hypothetical protein
VGGSAPADFFPAGFALQGPHVFAYHVVSNVTFGKYFFSGTATDREINIRVTFTTTNIPPAGGGSVGLFWGGHLASGLPVTWGVGNGAGSISGAPFHMRTVSFDGGGSGNQDRSLQPNAIVCVDPDCTISGPDEVFAGSTGNIFSGVAGHPVYNWSVSGNAGVTIDGSTNSQSVKIDVAANATGSFTVTLTVTMNLDVLLHAIRR